MMPSLVKSTIIAVSKRTPWLRRFIRETVRVFEGIRYRIAHHRPVQTRTVLFEAFSGRNFAGSPRAIYEQMLSDERFSGWRFVWAFTDPRKATRSQFTDTHTQLVTYGSREYYEASSTAQWWITNSIMASHLKPRRGQQQIQTWHGTAFKRLGADVIDETKTATNSKSEIVSRYRRAGEQATYILSSSPFTSQTFTTAFVLTPSNSVRKILPTGNPRNDILVDPPASSREALCKKLSIPESKKVILYAPTWRDDQHASRVGYTYQLGLDFQRLRDVIGEDYVVLFRAHYLVSSHLDLSPFKGFVYDVSSYDEVNELYLASDILVTDYSSVFFDYVLLDRPIIFHMYDLDHYRERLRGLYLDLTELPGPACQTQDELAQLIITAQERQADEARKRAEFCKAFATFDDGQATARVLDLVIETSNGSRVE